MYSYILYKCNMYVGIIKIYFEIEEKKNVFI